MASDNFLATFYRIFAVSPSLPNFNWIQTSIKPLTHLSLSVQKLPQFIVSFCVYCAPLYPLCPLCAHYTPTSLFLQSLTNLVYFLHERQLFPQHVARYRCKYAAISRRRPGYCGRRSWFVLCHKSWAGQPRSFPRQAELFLQHLIILMTMASTFSDMKLLSKSLLSPFHTEVIRCIQPTFNTGD